jgi:hypothetical protein
LLAWDGTGCLVAAVGFVAWDELVGIEQNSRGFLCIWGGTGTGTDLAIGAGNEEGKSPKFDYIFGGGEKGASAMVLQWAVLWRYYGGITAVP